MKNPNFKLPSEPGVYVLIIRLEKPEVIEVGRLGKLEFRAGWYAYVGSALGGLAGRVGRHLRREKKLRWHIDYLLRKGRLLDVVWALSQEKLECIIADGLRRSGLRSVPKFGASDCGCRSHLFYSPKSGLRNCHMSHQIHGNHPHLNLPPSRGKRKIGRLDPSTGPSTGSGCTQGEREKGRK